MKTLCKFSWLYCCN